MKSIEEAFSSIESLILNDVLPYTETGEAGNYDSLLEARDSDEFATPWADAYDVVSKLYKESDINQDIRDRVNIVREHIFKQVYNKTKVSDLASYISDDFELILMCLVTKTQNSWVNALWTSYQDKNIPHVSLTEVPGNLVALVN